MNRPNMAVLAACAVSCLALTVSACGASDAKSAAGNGEVTLAAGPASLSGALSMVVESFNLDEANGFTMTKKNVSGSGSVLASGLLSGEFDLATLPALTVATIDAKGQGLVVLGCQAQLLGMMAVNPGTYAGLGVTIDSPIKDRIAALKGLTIVTTPAGSSFNASLRALLIDNGLDPAKDVTIIETADSSAVVSGLKQGRYDAGWITNSILAGPIESGDAKILIDLPAGDLADNGAVRSATTMTVATSRKWAEQNPDLADNYAKALSDAADKALSVPDEVGTKLKADFFAEMPQNVFDRTWADPTTIIPSGGECAPGTFEGAANLMKDLPENKDTDFSNITNENIVWRAK